MITKEDAVYLKGIAIVMVLTGHLVPPFLPFAEIYVPLKKLISQVGVEIFLVISGYGVAVSYLIKQVDPFKFMAKRMATLWPIYVFSMAFYTLFSTLVFHEKISLFSIATHLLWLQSLLGTQDDIYSASHFFTTLLVVYLLSFLMMFAKSIRGKVVVYLSCMVLFQMFCLYAFNSFMFTNYIASFSLGLVVGLYCVKDSAGPYVLVWLLFSYLFCFFDSYHFQKAIAGVLCFFSSLMTIKKCNLDRVGQILSVVGFHSYVIYLGHNYFLWKWPVLLALTNSVLSTGCIILVLTGIWMVVMFVAYSLLNSFVTKPVLQKLDSIV